MDKKIIWKFNIIDLLIIGIVVLSLAALVYKIAWDSGEDIREYEITCICDESPTELLYEIRTGTKCADGDSGTSLGSVDRVGIEPIYNVIDKSKGTIFVNVEGTKTEHGISVDDTIYLKGTKLNLIIGDSLFEVYISDIKTLTQ